MSSCVASSCTCCPKASFAFATLVFSPTADAPLSYRFAFKDSTPTSHRAPSPKPPLPRSPCRFGSVPNVVVLWWLSRDLPLPNSNSALHPFSQESPRETKISSSLARCASPPVAVVCSFSPHTICWLTARLKVAPRPHSSSNETNLNSSSC